MNTFWLIFTSSLVAINCSLLGTFLILRRTAMMGDAISHAILPGIVLGFFFTGSTTSPFVIVGAAAMGLLASFLISFLQNYGRVQSDAAIGIIFTCLFALGIILISIFTHRVDLDQECVLYGEMAHVPLDTWTLANGLNLGPKAIYSLSFLLLLNLTLILIFYSTLKITTFDPVYSQSLGINEKFFHYLLMGATSLTAVMAFKSVGAILVIALLVAPAATAYLLTNSLVVMLAGSCLLGIFTSFFGVFLAKAYDGSITGGIACISSILFCIAYLYQQVLKNKKNT